MDEFVAEPTERRYVLKCKSKFFNTHITEDIGRGRTSSYERQMVLLIPQDSDERTKFLMAWLPDVPEQYYEIVAFISYPVDSPCRLSIHRGPDKRSERHYLYVMSKGVEDIIRKMPEGAMFKVEVLKASEDAEADFATDADNGNYHLLGGDSRAKK